MDANPPPPLLQEPRPTRLKRALRRLDLKFLFVVVLPTLLAAGYYGFLASDIFISESRFVVRNPQRAQQSGLGALLQGSGFSRSQDDTYSVQSFILSRDALRELDAKLQIRNAFSETTIDAVNRFPGLEPWDNSFEALYRHYLRHVSVEYDNASSISVLRVRLYSADGARRVNEMLLEMSERLVNNMNLRSRKDLIQVAEQEVTLAEARSKSAAESLAAFRSNRAVFDPDRQSAVQLQSVARLREELLAAEAQLAQVRALSPSNPQIASLETRVQGLKSAIGVESGRMLDAGGGLAAKSPVFDRLVLEKSFADRQLGGALATLDAARSEAARKQLYLERLVQPNAPDSALEPRRLRAVFTVLVVGLALWGVLSLVLASIREHTD